MPTISSLTQRPFSSCKCDLNLKYHNLKLVLLMKPHLNSLSANPTKWSDTLKQFVGKLPLLLYIYIYIGDTMLHYAAFLLHYFILLLLPVCCYRNRRILHLTNSTVTNIALTQLVTYIQLWCYTL